MRRFDSWHLDACRKAESVGSTWTPSRRTLDLLWTLYDLYPEARAYTVRSFVRTLLDHGERDCIVSGAEAGAVMRDVGPYLEG